MMMYQQPGMIHQQPGMIHQQPGILQQQPGMMHQQPGMMYQQPWMMQQQPGMNIQQPGIAEMGMVVNTSTVPNCDKGHILQMSNGSPYLLSHNRNGFECNLCKRTVDGLEAE